MSEHTVLIRLDELRQDDVVAPHVPDPNKQPPPDKSVADIRVEAKKDDEGKYSLITFAPTPECEKWVCTRVELPQIEFPNGAEWIEVEAWNDGDPIKIIADATDLKAPCFEISFCPNDTTWDGWKTFRVPLRGNQFHMWKEDVDREIQNPLRIKYMLILMRQGLPWRIGLRKMTIGLDAKQ